MGVGCCCWGADFLPPPGVLLLLVALKKEPRLDYFGAGFLHETDSFFNFFALSSKSLLYSLTQGMIISKIVSSVSNYRGTSVSSRHNDSGCFFFRLYLVDMISGSPF